MKKSDPYHLLPLLFFTVFHANIVCAQVDTIQTVIDHAKSQCGVTTGYDPAYYKIPYPNGDLPIEKGVCTDVIIRALRSVDIDLQELIHEDMKKHFAEYPRKWGHKKPDTNIDHRRVPNIQKYLERTGRKLPVSRDGKTYLPGDVVTWQLPGGLDHIGMVIDVPVTGTDRYGIVHNIGYGAQMEDILFSYPITGHYRFFRK